MLFQPRTSCIPPDGPLFGFPGRDIAADCRLVVIECLIAVLACMSGCSTINPATIQSETKLRSFKTAYVVTHGGNSADMDTHLQEALVNRGLEVRAGPESSKPTDVGFYAVYSDSWKWDLTMYLKELHIQFYEAKSGVLLASGSFSNSLLHSFPDPGKKVADVVATMYGEKPPD